MTSSQVREARKAKGWTQAKLAGVLGVSQNLISLVERGERTVNPELAAQIRKSSGYPRLSIATNSSKLPADYYPWLAGFLF
ncbi:MAG: hypothetical protein CLLPBCKN_008602 [Chroococcidiopsis cubana SAG 39.79]|uniref:helix-turn-helix domain-containing protein n=1 Tax=Chroococcidiopsis cubana TaxID=171392 RepID=UPI002AC4249D|nr:helix-turn-helix transcriptional regulator [Chroococcidiopsis cubana]MDZ4879164.1 hypothetical protein [Chroococcidiopsis cubana SAG 39.79]